MEGVECRPSKAEGELIRFGGELGFKADASFCGNR